MNDPILSRGGAQYRDAVSPRHHTIASIAKALGLSREAARQWATGRAKPRHELRARLEELLGIPASSWEEPAVAPLPESSAPKKTRPKTQRAA